MIQFNLLPDVKLEYVKARRTQQTVVMIAAISAAAALAILILLFGVVHGLQRKHLRDLNGDIKSYSNQLNEVKDLDKILTVQNQLNSLPDLHSQKVVASRLFGYLAQLTPAQASIADFNIDFAAHTISISGSADSLITVNKFTDTLKFTKFNAGEKKDADAFSDVVLASFSKSDQGTNYEINFSYDPAIFEGTNDVTLTVPKIISTRSETEKPEALFQQSSLLNRINR